MIHPAIEYMDKALELTQQHSLLAVDKKHTGQLTQLRDEVKAICSDFNKFSDRAERNPLKGKVAVFKGIYKFEIYIPAHDKYVGKNIDWKALDCYHDNQLFIKLKKLFDLKHLSGSAQFNALVASWLELKNYKCSHTGLDQTLETSTFARSVCSRKKTDTPKYQAKLPV